MDSIYLSVNDRELRYPDPGPQPRTGEVKTPDTITANRASGCRNDAGVPVRSDFSL
jgi:hypothetical protein